MREDNMHSTELLCFFRQLLFLFKFHVILSSSFLKKKKERIDIDV